MTDPMTEARKAHTQLKKLAKHAEERRGAHARQLEVELSNIAQRKGALVDALSAEAREILKAGGII